MHSAIIKHCTKAIICNVHRVIIIPLSCDFVNHISIWGWCPTKSFVERYKVMLIRKQIYGCTAIEETICGGRRVGGGGDGGRAHANYLSGEQRCRD